ncbi:unnamed protein product [Rotaria sp. Silwood1]|nr:unnamed protein product [Rotaria sp. Silwood1]CAF4061518.1 unnamed protein product [Rotaria sp. Silwood1]CAF5116014.1 unnamed protein product [Rotaria sp. Silwood1]
MISHQNAHPQEPIAYRQMMSPSKNMPSATIPPLMKKRISYPHYSPVISNPGLPQRIQQQNKSPIMSSPALRRRLNDSGDSQQPQQHKKHRTNEEYDQPQNMNLVLEKQQDMIDNRFTLAHLKRAISNNLPCFYIQFEEDLNSGHLPSTMKVIHILNQFFSNKWEPAFKGFTICSVVGKNRMKIGTNNKVDYFNLMNSIWPDKIENKAVKINKPKFIPDCFAFVVRNEPSSMPKEQVVNCIYQGIKSAVQFNEIKYYNNENRPTIDYRFAITDINEYYAALNQGRIAICNQLFPLTPFRAGYKMTYCSKCWKLGHTREICNEQPRCRICLTQFENNVQHNCLGTPKCAQCNEAHWSLDNKCLVVKQYRYDLKKAINDAIITGKISKYPSNENENENKRPFIGKRDDFPVLRHETQKIKSTAWNQNKSENIEILHELQKINGSMSSLRDEIGCMGKKLIEENCERVNQIKFIQQQQHNLIVMVNHVQVVIKSIIESLPELSNKVKKKIDKQITLMNDITKQLTSNEIRTSSMGTMSTQTDTLGATTSKDPGGGNGNEQLNMSTDTDANV